MEKSPKTKLSYLVRPLVIQVQEIGFRKFESRWVNSLEVTMLYLDKKADLKQLRSAASDFLNMKNESILDKRPLDAMLYDVMAYLVASLESAVEGNKQECLSYLASAKQLLKDAQMEKDL